MNRTRVYSPEPDFDDGSAAVDALLAAAIVGVAVVMGFVIGQSSERAKARTAEVEMRRSGS